MSIFKGISSHSSQHISDILDKFFNGMSDSVLSPEFRKIKNGKNIIFSSFPESSLPAIFKIALEQKQQLSPIENDVLKKLLTNANEYLEALRSKTKAELLGELDSYIANSALKGIQPAKDDITNIIRENLDKAGNKFQVVAEAEASHIRNLSRAINISKSGADMGVQDPMVFWIIVRDAVTCISCIENHLMPDKITPRLFYLSEVNSHWLDKAQRLSGQVSLWGQHCGCRCTLTQCPPFFGFKNGKLSYIGRDINPLKEQRGEE